MEMLCADCRQTFPANETIEITEKVLASTRSTKRVYSGVRGGIGLGGSSGVTYRFRDRTICLSCAEDRAAAAQQARDRQNRRRVVTFAVLAVAAASAIGLERTVPHDVNSAPANLLEPMSDASPVTPQPIKPQVDPTASSPPEKVAAAPIENSEQPPSLPEPSQSRQSPSANPQIDPFSSPAISEATDRALEAGRAQKWADETGKGYVLVSSPQVSDTNVCRNVQIVRTSSGEQVPGPTKVWCKIEDSAWSPR